LEYITTNMTLMSTMYQDIEEEEQSPTDTSEDSIEVQVKPIKSVMAGSTNNGKKNKRKSQEPKRLANTEVNSDMKRCRLNSTGSEERSPPVTYSRSPSPPSPTSKSSSASPVSSKRTSLSPMCLAPKKRFKLDALRELEQINSEVKPDKSETEKEASKSPFRPWSREGSAAESSKSEVAGTGPVSAVAGVPYIPFLLHQQLRHPTIPPMLPLYPYLPPYLPLPPKSDVSPSSLSPSSPNSSPPPPQDEPLSLVIKDKRKENNNGKIGDNNNTASPSLKDGDRTKSSPIKASSGPTRPPVFNVEALMNAQKVLSSTNILQSPTRRNITGSSASALPTTPTRVRNDSGSTSSSGGEADKAKQRNYKNMTRERRVEANARERQRVHTITAAFDTLQAAIPTEEQDIKLSKLSVIKIATAYIMALSRMAGHDYTEDQSAPPVEEVVQHCSEVIEKECRIKKRNGSQ